jgi:hypothetical protein
MFAIWYLLRFGNLFIQSAAKCTCTKFILQISKTFLCQSLRNHWKTFLQQRREKSLIVMSNYGNSKLTIWSLITVANGGMRVWHFNGVITTYGKRDCRNSWRYASLAVNRGAIKRGYRLTDIYVCSSEFLVDWQTYMYVHLNFL